MKWEGNRQSDNVEDRRGESAGGSSGGGMVGGRGIGIGTIVIALLGGWIFGINPMTILSLLSGGSPTAQVQHAPAPQHAPANDQMTRFVRTVLADTEDVWGELFTPDADGLLLQCPGKVGAVSRRVQGRGPRKREDERRWGNPP